jgi:hypothetical protein
MNQMIEVELEIAGHTFRYQSETSNLNRILKDLREDLKIKTITWDTKTTEKQEKQLT